MANFGTLILTKEGMRLQALAEGGTTLKAKRMAMGSGRVSGSIMNMTALVKEEVSVPISKGVLQNGNSWLFDGYFSNEQIQTGFYWRELGLFMQDPSDPLKEILYCYSNAGETADYIPPNQDERYEKYLDIQVAFSNASEITIEVPQTLVLVSKPEFDAHIYSNMHFHVVDSTGTGSALVVSYDMQDHDLTNGFPLLVKLVADIEAGATLKFNELEALPIVTSDGKAVTKSAKAGYYIPLAYTGTAWELIGGGGGGEEIPQFTRNKETIYPTQNGQKTFTLSKGEYTVGANCLDVNIDGIPQPASAFTETSATSFTLHDSFEILTTTQIDVSYMKISPIQNAETPTGAQMKVDELEASMTEYVNGELKKKANATTLGSYAKKDLSNVPVATLKEAMVSVGTIKTFKLPMASWSANAQSIVYTGLTEFSSIKLQYATPDVNLEQCETCGIKISSVGEGTITLSCETVPTMDVVIDILYQGERDKWFEWTGSAWTEHTRS